MAVLDEVPRLEVDILVNDKSLPEYDDITQPTSFDTVTKYIETGTGNQFEIRHAFKETPSSEGVINGMGSIF
jgi:hypothetical protein